MGKKSSRKKGRTKWIRPTPDEVVSRGPLSIARYGRSVLLSNQSTPEEHREFLRRAADANRRIHKELAEKVGNLQDLIYKYDAVLLLHRAAYVLLPLFLKYRSGNEFDSEESLSLPGVEYLQYLIARTEANTTGAEPTEEEWEAAWSLTLDVLRLTQQYLFTRRTEATPPSEIDDLRFHLDSARLAIRVQRYPFFLRDYWKDSLLPYKPWIKELYGISVEDLMHGLQALEEYQKTGVLGRYADAMNARNALLERLREKGYAVDSDATGENMECTRQALASPEFVDAHTEAQEKARLAFTPAIFDITDLTSLPRSLLSTLSVRPGEAVLRDPTLTKYDDLSPLSDSLWHFKPFLQVDDRFYWFYHSGFEDHIAEIIEGELLSKRSRDSTMMAKKHSDHIEKVSKELLSSVLRPDFVFERVYYPNPDRPGDLTELDIMLGVDDLLFLVEVKSGGLSAAASRGAPKSLASDLSDLIIAGQRQSERAERYIKSQSETVFYDESGKNVVHRLRIADYRTVFRVVVTREFLGWVGAKIAVLSILDPGLSKSFPWHISVDDLRIVAELFVGKDLQFVHFLEQRLQASVETVMSQHDEIEHVALYQRLNQYHELPIRGVDHMSFDPSYMKHIDFYFAARYAGEFPRVPEQNLPPKMSGFLEALSTSRLPGRFEVASILLSMGQEGRDEFEANLVVLEDRRSASRQPSLHLPFGSDSIGLSVTYASEDNFNEELVRCAARMQQGGSTRWLVVQLKNQSTYLIRKIRIITPSTFSEVELSRGRSHIEQQVIHATSSRKIGRNEHCPCGSGRKYKACHGR